MCPVGGDVVEPHTTGTVTVQLQEIEQQTDTNRLFNGKLTPHPLQKSCMEVTQVVNFHFLLAQ